MSWLDEVVASTAEAESPARFQYWSALAAVSAVVKKNVVLDRFMYKLYPNIYVILVGKSGLRKGNPVTLAKNLVTATKATRIIQGRGTIQAKIKELGKAHSIDGGGVEKNAAGFLVSGEMDSFFIKDPDAMTILTDLYDTHAHEPEWTNATKTQGIDTLKNPCLTILGGTNEEHFRSAIAEKDVKGGFVARTLIVYESERRLINDLLDRPKRVPNMDELTCYLKEVSKVKGEFKLSDDARDVYRPWYKTISSMSHDDQTGTIERIGDTVLKVSMLLALTEAPKLKISGAQMEEAIYVCMECMDALKLVVVGAGVSNNEVPGLTAKVLRYLMDQPSYTGYKRKMLAKFWDIGVDTLMLDRIMETLIQAGAVDPHTVGKDVFYIMKSEHVDAYRRFKREVN